MADWSARIALLFFVLFLLTLFFHRVSIPQINFLIPARHVDFLMGFTTPKLEWSIGPIPQLSTPNAMQLLGVAIAAASVAVALGMAALVSIWREGHKGVGNATIGVFVGLVMLALPLKSLPSLLTLPRIHEVSTDTEHAPAFHVLARKRGGADANAVPYQSSTAALQIAAYPDIKPLIINRPVDEGYGIARAAAMRLWGKKTEKTEKKEKTEKTEKTDAKDAKDEKDEKEEKEKKDTQTVLEADQPPEGMLPGKIEATARSLIFGITDDVVIRIAGNDRETRIDVHASSRYGEHDLGRNAEHVREFFSEVKTRISELEKAERTKLAFAARELRVKKAQAEKLAADKERVRKEKAARRAAIERQRASSAQSNSGGPGISQSPSQSSYQGDQARSRRPRQQDSQPSLRKFWESLTR